MRIDEIIAYYNLKFTEIDNIINNLKNKEA